MKKFKELTHCIVTEKTGVWRIMDQMGEAATDEMVDLFMGGMSPTQIAETRPFPMKRETAANILMIKMGDDEYEKQLLNIKQDLNQARSEQMKGRKPKADPNIPIIKNYITQHMDEIKERLAHEPVAKVVGTIIAEYFLPTTYILKIAAILKEMIPNYGELKRMSKHETNKRYQPMSKRRPKVTYADRIKNMYVSSGHSIADIANKMSTTPEQVKQILADGGVSI